MRRIKGKETQNSSPFDMSSHKTERTGVSILMHWMRQIIEDKSLDLGMPDVETSSDDRKMPDVVIYESQRSEKVLCVIEAKPPHYFDVFDEKLKDDARKKANNRGAKYFATTNFKTLIWWKTQEANNPSLSEEQQIAEKYTLSEIESLDEIEQIRYSNPIKKSLEDFLTKLYSVYSGKEPEPKLAIDDFLVFRIHEKIGILANYYRRIIDDRFHKDSSFEGNLKKWFRDQNWEFAHQYEDFAKVARQTAYLLVNKILFYDLLQAKRPNQLDPLEIPESRTQSSMLKDELQAYFNKALKIDYETIYTTDFIDTIAFPDSNEVVKEIKGLINVLRRYDFSKLGYDIIGRIFERIIPHDERHNLGQYFTSPDVVDLILKFCLHHEDDKILDPSCGAGTFLVRAYQHKKMMNQRLEHENMLETLWGSDIAKFPAHLATINLAINNLSSDRNYPNILHEDFFKLIVGESGFDPESWRKSRAKTLGLTDRDIVYPRWFDAIVGNPPYTRQEEIPETGVDKEDLIENALKVGGIKIAEISKRASIHAYFFVHGTKFLKDGGYFGFIVSNSWLDVDYGKGLQEFFLKNYKIVAIIESKIERWFQEADINTCIVILQKCDNAEERDNNLARFVYLKKRLRDFIPSAQDDWDEQAKRLDEIEKLKRTILGHSYFYENDDMRIFPKSQKELWDEGFDVEEGKYVGAKWGKYLRAPEIFFKILEKGKDKLVPLKEIASVRFGIKTGANEFFYLTEEEIKKKGIEKEFWMHQDRDENWVPNYVIKSPRECKSIIIKSEDLKYKLLMIHKGEADLEGTKILKYIKQGKNKKFNERPTCKSRNRWYELIEIKSPILSKRFVDEAFCYFLNPRGYFIGDTFFAIDPKDKFDTFRIATFLNSTLGVLLTEVYGRTVMGEGVLLIYGPEISPMPILDPKLISNGKRKTIRNFLMGKVTSIFDEIGTSSNDVSLDKIRPERRELDKIIMGDILGLTDDEQLEVYKAVIDLVRSRIDKAKSLENGTIIDGINIDILNGSIVKTIDAED